MAVIMPPIALQRFGPRNNLHGIGVKGAMKRLVGTLGVLVFFALGAVGALRVWNIAGGAYDAATFPIHVEPGVSPRLKGSDAYMITLDFLTRSAAEAAPGTPTAAASLQSIWAVTADQAAALDGCIPTGKGSGVVWVTKGAGTYANTISRAWSSPDSAAPAACRISGTAGTLVIDDATGQILGVYPFSGAAFPHPSPQVTLAPAAPTPTLPSATPKASGAPKASGSPKPSSTAKPSPSPKPSASGG
jgi:hypothetical protein